MSERIKISILRDYGACGHEDSGCSGWESVTVIASNGVRTESHQQASCFGVSEQECFEEVINNWVRLV